MARAGTGHRKLSVEAAPRVLQPAAHTKNMRVRVWRRVRWRCLGTLTPGSARGRRIVQRIRPTEGGVKDRSFGAMLDHLPGGFHAGALGSYGLLGSTRLPSTIQAPGSMWSMRQRSHCFPE